MSEHGFHGHDPHNHAVKHAAHGSDGFSNCHVARCHYPTDQKKWMMGLAYGVAALGTALGVLIQRHIEPIGAMTGRHTPIALDGAASSTTSAPVPDHSMLASKRA